MWLRHAEMMLPMQIKRLSFMLLFCVLAHSVVLARPGTQPPSVALRTALSHVMVADLSSLQEQSGDTVAVFAGLRSLHNTETALKISLVIPPQALPMLETGQRYIIAYQKQRRVGKGEPRRYEPFPDGPVLLTEQGANPAIFPYHQRLEDSLSADPAQAASQPQQLIDEILVGLRLNSLAHKHFYLRELINWTRLRAELTSQHIDQLRTVFKAPWLTAEMLAAFYEPRLKLQQQLGVKMLRERAMHTLTGSPVNLDLMSAQPYLLLQMLNFITANADNASLETDILARWLYSNQHLVAEKALLLIARQDSEMAVSLVQDAIYSSALPSPVNRVLQRFLRNH